MGNTELQDDFDRVSQYLISASSESASLHFDEVRKYCAGRCAEAVMPILRDSEAKGAFVLSEDDRFRAFIFSDSGFMLAEAISIDRTNARTSLASYRFSDSRLNIVIGDIASFMPARLTEWDEWPYSVEVEIFWQGELLAQVNLDRSNRAQKGAIGVILRSVGSRAGF
ncbi:hypothetical protein [Kocuria sp. HSID16901]|uniref:hypothetical protein n=1 Tax=Kocuria sp. HSID16901 TaxID=2419505 RepID=UPI000F877B3E|nr:hypothetical protein [Kocuria sp. HSID16901]RUQ23158.1 hypothetical protein D8M21_00005 [Kocuria sp. HSID16901]